MSRITERAVVFDVDGTLALCDSTNDALTEILIRHGVAADRETLKRTISAANSDWVIVESCLPEPARVPAYGEILHANAAAAARAQCHPEIASMLAALARDHRLFVLSGRDQASIDVILQRHRLAPFFESIVSASPGTVEKPDPAALIELLAAFDIDHHSATYVGDKDVDVELAGRAGIGFIGVTWYRDRLSVDCRRVGTPSELLRVLRQTNRFSSSVVLRTITSQE